MKTDGKISLSFHNIRVSAAGKFYGNFAMPAHMYTAISVSDHALAESILGALALGDLGTHFPDNDPEYKGIDSAILVRRVVAMMEEKGYEVNNVDISITLEQPKLKSFILKMRENIAELLKVDVDAVSVKAGTNEKLDAIGMGLAVKAEFIILLKEKE